MSTSLPLGDIMVCRIVVAALLLGAATVGWTAERDDDASREREAAVTQQQTPRSGQQYLPPGQGSRRMFWTNPNSRTLALVKFLIAVSVTMVLAAIALPAQYKQERARRRARSKPSSHL
jgi:Flp pilus assembly protein TadB